MKKHHWYPLLAAAVMFVCMSATAVADSRATMVDAIQKNDSVSRFSPLFPNALYWQHAHDSTVLTETLVATVHDEQNANEPPASFSRLQSELLNNDVIALYGKPGARNMGILGQYTIEEIEPVMDEFVRAYDEANGIRGVIPAVYIIYGTVWPEGEIGLTREAVIHEYIEFAHERGWYVFIDHQIGRYSVENAVQTLLPWLKYPNVHLAIDPEWRTDKPMQEIGYVTGDELNMAQQMIQDYIVENNLPGRRMLVFHQFKPKMIANRNAVRSDFERVKLIHCADGFGNPGQKINAYRFNALAENIPLKSFKLFLKPTIEKAGWDKPLMSPEEVLSLDPRPYLIMYQ